MGQGGWAGGEEAAKCAGRMKLVAQTTGLLASPSWDAGLPAETVKQIQSVAAELGAPPAAGEGVSFVEDRDAAGNGRAGGATGGMIGYRYS
jgi:hypothetical protein